MGTIVILIIIGLPLLLLWLYADEKTKNQRKTTDGNLEAFACPICKMIRQVFVFSRDMHAALL
jgi:hypothetical protein